MLHSRFLAVLATAAILGGTSAAFAGQWICTDQVAFPADSETINPAIAGQTYYSTNHSYNWSLGEDGVTGYATMNDNKYTTDADQHLFTETVEGDPIKFITETIYNDSPVNWIGYQITVVSNTPGVTVVFGATASASASLMDPVVIAPNQLDFSGVITNTPLLAVPPSSTTLNYSLIITPPVGWLGAISYTVTEIPIVGSGDIPEPASLGLLGLGAAGLLRRRRK